MKERAEAVHKNQSRQTQRQFFQGNHYSQALRCGSYGYWGGRAHHIPQWATNLYSLKHFIKKAFRGRTGDYEEEKVGPHPEIGPFELNNI